MLHVMIVKVTMMILMFMMIYVDGNDVCDCRKTSAMFRLLMVCPSHVSINDKMIVNTYFLDSLVALTLISISHAIIGIVNRIITIMNEIF